MLKDIKDRFHISKPSQRSRITVDLYSIEHIPSSSSSKKQQHDYNTNGTKCFVIFERTSKKMMSKTHQVKSSSVELSSSSSSQLAIFNESLPLTLQISQDNNGNLHSKTASLLVMLSIPSTPSKKNKKNKSKNASKINVNEVVIANLPIQLDYIISSGIPQSFSLPLTLETKEIGCLRGLIHGCHVHDDEGMSKDVSFQIPGIIDDEDENSAPVNSNNRDNKSIDLFELAAHSTKASGNSSMTTFSDMQSPSSKHILSYKSPPFSTPTLSSASSSSSSSSSFSLLSSESVTTIDCNIKSSPQSDTTNEDVENDHNDDDRECKSKIIETDFEFLRVENAEMKQLLIESVDENNILHKEVLSLSSQLSSIQLESMKKETIFVDLTAQLEISHDRLRACEEDVILWKDKASFLEQLMRQKSTEHQSMTSAIESLSLQCDKMKEKYDSIVVTQFNDQTEWSKTNQALIANVESLTTEIESERSSFATSLAQINEQINSYLQTIQQLESDVLSKDVKIAEINSSMNEILEQLLYSRNKLRECHENTVKLETKVTKLVQLNSQLQRDLVKASDVNEIEKKRIFDEKKAMIVDIESLRHQYDELKKQNIVQIDLNNESKILLQQETDNLRIENSNSRKLLAEAVKEKSNLHENINRLSSQLLSLQIESEKHVTTIADLTSRLEHNRIKLDDNEEEVVVWKEKATMLDLLIKQRFIEHQTMRATIENLSSQCDNLKQEYNEIIVAHNNNHEEWNNNNQSLLQNIKTLTIEIETERLKYAASLEFQLQAKDVIITDIIDNQKQLTAQLEYCRNKLRECHENTVKLETKVTKLVQLNSQLQRDLDRASEVNEIEKKQIFDEKKAMIVDIEALRHQYDELKKQYDIVIAAHNKEIDELNIEIQLKLQQCEYQYTQKLVAETALLISVEDKHSNLLHDYSLLQEEKARMKLEIEDLQQEKYKADVKNLDYSESIIEKEKNWERERENLVVERQHLENLHICQQEKILSDSIAMTKRKNNFLTLSAATNAILFSILLVVASTSSSTSSSSLKRDSFASAIATNNSSPSPMNRFFLNVDKEKFREQFILIPGSPLPHSHSHCVAMLWGECLKPSTQTHNDGLASLDYFYNVEVEINGRNTDISSNDGDNYFDEENSSNDDDGDDNIDDTNDEDVFVDKSVSEKLLTAASFIDDLILL